MRVFVAGATGAIGQHLIPALIEAGHEVTGTTRSAGKADGLQRLGARPVVVDGLDRAGVLAAVADAKPDVIVHQMTALSDLRSFRRLDKAFAVTNELRTRGTDYLLEAARAAGVRRFIAQSYTGVPNIRTGGPVKSEEDPFDPHPPAAMTQTLGAIRHVETVVPGGVPEGLMLRYGGFYGPGTGNFLPDAIRKRKMPVIGSGAGVWSFIHIEDAAAATAAAVERGLPGVYNIVDDEPAPVSEWLPYLAECFGAKPPMHFPAWVGRLAAGEVGVSMMTQIRGSSNAKAKRGLGWAPRYASWRTGFRAWAAALEGPAEGGPGLKALKKRAA
ncbi:MAG: NAD-dependent epimerase/dehydratase family protein [Micromonosporaceae bacterium]